MNREKDSMQSDFQKMRDWALIMNAHFHFSVFKSKVINNTIKYDGTDTLLNEIDKYVLSDSGSQFHKTIEVGTELYRARVISPEEINNLSGISVDKVNGEYITHGYDESNSRECPLGIGSAGRNNIAGVSYLYLANSPEVACAEVKPPLLSLISVATFKVKRPIVIVDFSEDKAFEPSDSISDNLALGPFFTLIMRQYFEPIHNDSDYKATQIITDHIRKSGVDGIAYRSNYHTGGVNYTIFNSNRESFEFVESKAFMFQSQQHNFCDFDKKMILSTQSQETSGYDAKLSDDILEKLYKRRHPPTWDDFG